MKQGWEIKKLVDITSFLGDGLHGTPKYTVDGEYYFINGNNLNGGIIEFKENTKTVSSEEYYKYKKNLNNRSVLVSINGTLGNVAFYNNEKIILGKSACYFNLLESVDKNFIKYILSSPYFLNYAHKEATGATIKNVSLKTMREFEIPLPPLPEQLRIVTILDKAFAAIATAKANAEQNLKNAKELFESYLQGIFENKRDNWAEKELGNVATTNGRIGWKGLTAKEYTDKGPLFLSVHSLNYGDFVDFSQAFHISQERYDESPEIMLKKDDILICKDGAGIGKLGIIPELPDITTINSSLLLIRCKKDILTKFLYYNLLSPMFQRIVQSRLSGATTPHLYQRDIVTFPILLPKLSEQQSIIQKLDALSTETKKLEAIYQQKVVDLEELKKSVLQKAFNGEL